jgi:hypothetical protein
VKTLDDQKKLDEILREAYRQRDAAEAGTEWRDDVMLRIAQMAPLDPAACPLSGLGGLARGLSPSLPC